MFCLFTSCLIEFKLLNDLYSCGSNYFQHLSDLWVYFDYGFLHSCTSKSYQEVISFTVLASIDAANLFLKSQNDPVLEATHGHLFPLYHITNGRCSESLPFSRVTECKHSLSYLGYAESRAGRSHGQPQWYWKGFWHSLPIITLQVWQLHLPRPKY